MSDHLHLRGVLKGHNGWVTSIATTQDNPDTIVSGSRDKTVTIWNLTRDDPSCFGQPKRALTGHGHYVSEVVLSSDGHFALSSSWDKTLRLWDLNTGVTAGRFVGHKKDVLSVAFSADNRHIVSGSRDRSLSLWNTLGENKLTIESGSHRNAHSDWVSCVRFSPAGDNPLVVSGSWDKTVKVWDLTTCELRTKLAGHTGYVNTVTISPDGSLCASGGKDGLAILWDLGEGKYLYSLEAGDVINALSFSPDRYWLSAATNTGIKIWDLESQRLVVELNKNTPDFSQASNTLVPSPACISLAWSADGSTLFAGYTDNMIRVWQVAAN